MKTKTGKSTYYIKWKIGDEGDTEKVEAKDIIAAMKLLKHRVYNRVFVKFDNKHKLRDFTVGVVTEKIKPIEMTAVTIKEYMLSYSYLEEKQEIYRKSLRKKNKKK